MHLARTLAWSTEGMGTPWARITSAFVRFRRASPYHGGLTRRSCDFSGGDGGMISSRPVSFALELAPAAGAVVRDDLLEHGAEGGRVERLALADGHRSRGLVLVSPGDDP